jgi:hypothetical protein
MKVDPRSQFVAAEVDLAHGNHFSCTLSAVVISRVRKHGGPAADSVLL